MFINKIYFNFSNTILFYCSFPFKTPCIESRNTFSNHRIPANILECTFHCHSVHSRSCRNNRLDTRTFEWHKLHWMSCMYSGMPIHNPRFHSDRSTLRWDWQSLDMRTNPLERIRSAGSSRNCCLCNSNRLYNTASGKPNSMLHRLNDISVGKGIPDHADRYRNRRKKRPQQHPKRTEKIANFSTFLIKWIKSTETNAPTPQCHTTS